MVEGRMSRMSSSTGMVRTSASAAAPSPYRSPRRVSVRTEVSERPERSPNRGHHGPATVDLMGFVVEHPAVAVPAPCAMGLSSHANDSTSNDADPEERSMATAAAGWTT